MKNTLRQNKGITLIALVITIIVLLILAGVTITNTYSYFSSYNNQFKVASANNTESTSEDYLQMKKSGINCHNISKVYWLASRNVGASSYSTSVGVRYVSSSGSLNYGNLCNVAASGTANSISIEYGLRPIFILKSDIHYTDDGTTKTLVQ